MPVVHCAGMVPSQVRQYVGRMLRVLEERYGIKKFASQTRLDPDLCLDTLGQLQVAAEAIQQIVQVFHERSSVIKRHKKIWQGVDLSGSRSTD